MKIFSLDKEYNVIWEPQILMLEPFNKLFKRDKSKGKTRANKELAFVYFYCDIRSDYQIQEPEDRIKSITNDLKMREDWKIDKIVEEAMEFYEAKSTSITAQILKDSTYVANRVSSGMRKAVEESDELDIKELASILDAIKKIPDVIKALKTAEREVLREIEEAQDKLGSKEKAFFEDGQLYK